MKKIPVSIVAALLMVTTIVIPKPRTFTGEIMDSQCAKLDTHGIVNPFKTARDCTIECVRLGGQYVLYNGTLRMTYRLDDQRNPEAFAGGRVEVVGTLDRMTNTIHVLFIRPADGETHTAWH